MNYYEEDKLAHVKRAKAYVENREGTYTSYAREHGIARTTFHQWMQTFVSDTQMQRSKEAKPLVRVGKPISPVTEEQKFVIEYYGSRIEVNSTDNLVALLKGIRIAGSI